MNNIANPPKEDSYSRLFKTTFIPLVAWLIAEEHLHYIGCRLSPNGHAGRRVEFLFHDPEQDARKLRMQFDSGATVPASRFYSTLGYVRGEINRKIRNNVKESNNNHGRNQPQQQ